jgi:hypothetical protein
MVGNIQVNDPILPRKLTTIQGERIASPTRLGMAFASRASSFQ